VTFVQAEAAGLRTDLLALRQFHLRSRALSTAGSESSRWSSEEEEEHEVLGDSYRPSRRSRYVVIFTFTIRVLLSICQLLQTALGQV